MSRHPDFVIAGAARCGTTALYAYLAKHPSVFMPKLKEPAFFSTDLPGGLSSAEEYAALFAGATAGYLTGEASTAYLYSGIAIERLVAHNPNVKVIVLLRDPVEAARSLHGYAYRYRSERYADFETAWHGQRARRAARDARGESEPLRDYDYSARYHYAPQVRRVLSHVPPQQRHFIVYEDFFADPAARFAELLRFLGLDPLAPKAFPVIHAHAAARSARLEQLLRRPPRLLRRLHATLRPLLEATGLRPAALVARLNWDERHTRALRPAFRLELERHFAADIAELEGLLDRSLWRKRQHDGVAT
jgi:hypothetical protein